MTIRTVGALMNDAFAFYKAHWKILGSITLIPGALQAVVAYFSIIQEQTSPGLLSIILLAVVIVALTLSIISAASLILAVENPSRYENPIEALKAGMKFFLPMLWIMAISALVYLGGLLLFIIPGIIFAIWFAFSYFTLVFEGKRGWAAMQASKAYVTGRWFPVAGRILAVIVVMIALSFIVEFVLAFIAPTKAIHNGLSALISSLYSPFMLIYMYYMYQDLKGMSASVAPAEETEVVSAPAATV